MQIITTTTGIRYVPDLTARKKLIKSIDEFKKTLRGRKIDVQSFIEENKKSFQKRTDILLNTLKK